jgi:hypothetical protein
MPFGEAVGEAFFGHFVGRVILRRPERHGLKFGGGRVAGRRVFCAVQHCEFVEQIRPLQDDAPPRMRRGQLTKVGEKLRVVKGVGQGPLVID